MSNEVSSEGARAADELEQLRKQKERIELKAQIAALGTPWWRKASLLATMTAIIAAVLPITTAIEERYRNERELVLQRSKQDADVALQQVRQENDIKLQQVKQENDIRMAYLDRFDVPGQRLQTLRFLIATSTDDRLLAWAREEQKVVQAQLDKIEQELLAVTRKIDQAPPGKALEDLRKEREKLERLKANTTIKAPPGAGSAPQ